MGPLFVDWYASLVGGLVGTIAMTVFWYAARAAGWLQLDFGQLLGTFFYPPGRRALAAGLSWHMLTGLAFGAVYGWVLVSAGIAPTWLSGLGLGVIHALVAVALLYPLARVHPALPDRRVNTAFSGRDRLIYALGFPIFGAFFGATYRSYATWVSATGMEPFRFWMTAFAVIAAMLVIGLATYRLIPRWREEQSPVFRSALPDREERRQALLRAHESGRLSQDELAAGLAELEDEDRV